MARRTDLAQVLDALLLELAPRALLQVHVLAVSHIEPGFHAKGKIRTTTSSKNYGEYEEGRNRRRVRTGDLPEEEGLAALAVEPDVIVDVEIVPIPVPRVNLQRSQGKRSVLG